LRVKKWGKKTATTKSSPKNTNKNAWQIYISVVK
jgi:hypothetical protein